MQGKSAEIISFAELLLEPFKYVRGVFGKFIGIRRLFPWAEIGFWLHEIRRKRDIGQRTKMLFQFIGQNLYLPKKFLLLIGMGLFQFRYFSDLGCALCEQASQLVVGFILQTRILHLL